MAEELPHRGFVRSSPPCSKVRGSSGGLPRLTLMVWWRWWRLALSSIGKGWRKIASSSVGVNRSFASGVLGSAWGVMSSTRPNRPLVANSVSDVVDQWSWRGVCLLCSVAAMAGYTGSALGMLHEAAEVLAMVFLSLSWRWGLRTQMVVRRACHRRWLHGGRRRGWSSGCSNSTWW